LVGEDEHALGEAVREGYQGEGHVVAHGFSLFGKKQKLQSKNRNLEGQVEESFEEEERARQAQDFG